jgi:hypothetical protein
MGASRSPDDSQQADRKAQRKADVALVTTYHEAHLRRLLERVRDGFQRYEEGELDAFGLDALIHQYELAVRELWKFCGDLSGASAASTARALRQMGDEAEQIDWWERGQSAEGR